MADRLVSAIIANTDNDLVISYSSDVAHWCIIDTTQSSKAAPAMAVLNNNLWAAFRGEDQTTIDGTGAQVGETLDIHLLGQSLAAGGTIGQTDLAQMVAFQVVLVGWAHVNGARGATLLSGGGTITCSSTTPMTPSILWPSDSDGDNGTAEEANSTYGLIPAQSSLSISQLSADR